LHYCWLSDSVQREFLSAAQYRTTRVEGGGAKIQAHTKTHHTTVEPGLVLTRSAVKCRAVQASEHNLSAIGLPLASCPPQLCRVRVQYSTVRCGNLNRVACYSVYSVQCIERVPLQVLEQKRELMSRQCEDWIWLVAHAHSTTTYPLTGGNAM